jgi:hypothetical protein
MSSNRDDLMLQVLGSVPWNQVSDALAGLRIHPGLVNE